MKTFSKILFTGMLVLFAGISSSLYAQSGCSSADVQFFSKPNYQGTQNCFLLAELLGADPNHGWPFRTNTPYSVKVKHGHKLILFKGGRIIETITGNKSFLRIRFDTWRVGKLHQTKPGYYHSPNRLSKPEGTLRPGQQANALNPTKTGYYRSPKRVTVSEYTLRPGQKANPLNHHKPRYQVKPARIAGGSKGNNRDN